MFQPDRVDDLRHQAGTLGDKENPAEVKLVDVNYETTVVTFAFDTESKSFKRKPPGQVLERISNLLRQASKGAFGVYPLSAQKPEQLKQERIAVAGLDCKGCAYGAYRVVAAIEGVERATVSFKDGHVTAWIDPARTEREALIAALEKARVTVVKDEASESLKKKP